jgi:hypothetical protein
VGIFPESNDERDRSELSRTKAILIVLCGLVALIELLSGDYFLAAIFAGLCAMWMWK